MFPLSVGRKTISSKWVFCTKYKADGSLEKLKAQLVVKGYSQRVGEDFFKTFSPVVRRSSVRFLVALVAQKNLELHQMDVQSVFLHGTIEEEIFMDIPEVYYLEPGQQGLVCKLKKALYGIKQSPNYWFACIKEYLLQMGFEQNPSDQNVFMLRDSQGFVLLALYVDPDTIMTTRSSCQTVHQVRF